MASLLRPIRLPSPKFRLLQSRAHSPRGRRPSESTITALNGFTDVDLYNLTRPSYPLEAVSLVHKLAAQPAAAGSSSPTIVELGAGTGIFTCKAASHDPLATYYANELNDVMRSGLSAATSDLGSVVVVGGSAGEIGGVDAPDGAADVVVAAQSFHWFRPYPAAYMEARRLLKPGGHLVMMWNERDLSVPWVKALEDEVITPLYPPGSARQQSKEWLEAFEHFLGSYYGNLHHMTVEKGAVQEGSHDVVVGRVMSLSAVQALEEAERVGVEGRVREWLSGREEVGDVVQLPYRTEIYHTQVIA